MQSVIQKFKKKLHIGGHHHFDSEFEPSNLTIPSSLLPSISSSSRVFTINSPESVLPLDYNNGAFSILPVEVLGQIFVACLPERDADRLDINSTPELLCQVNTYWRAVAISEPKLWDTVILPTSSNYARYFKFVRGGGVQRWFDRTGPARLLTFGEELSEDSSSSLIDEYLGIVIKYARRFKHLSIVMTKIMHIESFRRGFPQDIFDQLESVSLCCLPQMNARTLQAFPKLVTPFLTAPKLRHVTFSLPRAEPTKFVLPWAQITSINVHSRRNPLNLEQWRSILQTCPRLQRGTFVYPRRDVWRFDGTPVHSRLKSLTLLVPPNHGSGDAPCDIPVLLAAVKFPNIRHLHFEFEGGSRSRHAHLDQLGRTCTTLSSLQTLTLGWPGEADRDAPVEASQFMTFLTLEPGAFTSLRHVVLPCRSNKISHVVEVLRSHPRLNVTVTATPNKSQEWTRAIQRYEQAVADRIYILSTADYYLLDDESYFTELL